MRPTELAAIAEALGVPCPSGAGATRVTGVVHDTRLIEGGELFFALPGEQVDGHSFIGEAFARGAVAAVSNRPSEARGPVLTARDPLQALGRLCKWYRATLRAQVAAITGSVGKTTTREMLGRVCLLCGPAVVTRGNLNTEVGVPLTVFRADDETAYLVLEFAMRGRGQIAWLADAAQPRVGAVTNIDAVHAELLGTVDAIAEAKSELVAALPPEGPQPCRQTTGTSASSASGPRAASWASGWTMAISGLESCRRVWSWAGRGSAWRPPREARRSSFVASGPTTRTMRRARRRPACAWGYP